MIADGRMTKRIAKGFTLIEILIVIVIISIVSGVALVTISNNKTKQLETFAKQLTRLITLAESEAMLQPATLGLGFYSHSFQFFNYNPSEDNPWQAITRGNLGLRKIPDHVKITLRVNNESKALDGKPHILISESGDITAFTITLVNIGDKPAYVVRSDASGNIQTEAYHEK
jgi:general secretion pathway protein H